MSNLGNVNLAMEALVTLSTTVANLKAKSEEATREKNSAECQLQNARIQFTKMVIPYLDLGTIDSSKEMTSFRGSRRPVERE